MDKKLEISKENGFYLMDCEKGISSLVFEKDGYVFKINKRNSLERAKKDYLKLQEICRDFPEKIAESFLSECIYEGEVYICIKQKKINAPSVKQIGKLKFVEFLKKNKHDLAFLKKLIDDFFMCVKERKLYPDIVGNPSDQSIFNSINILVEPERGLVVCDIGLSPHEDTLKKHGLSFYDSDNVSHYLKKMDEAFEEISRL
ncbi:MAG: hypothetical protein WAV31_03525 [Candidatus Moraniibacteriota bacterium]